MNQYQHRSTAKHVVSVVGLCIQSSKRRFSAEYAALMIAVNGGFSALGTPLSFQSSTSWGFSSTFILGLLAYLLAAGALFIGRLDK